ncbi:Mitochondrial intermembrane space cysteine motif-containing protein MIX14 [Hanseniaspora osmophila]|uniref:Mitochondrial intermembrane space cysteine motif-containing protein MIX14 n=1 Tax=Hanseniaspora osmophila TaxID=56408 RepID=A0A1E5RV90_9ASCO|nr:Mitochondrial intermembrane space cysteine motif-containing protein MIX14 [Hanseniaspora osmophila]
MNTHDSVLDQIIMEDVSFNCPQQFMAYHKCISENHEDPSKCAFRQQDLSNCIKTSVPSVMKIMKTCGPIMQKYETCLRDNMESRTINENCIGLLNEMRQCAMNQIDVSKRSVV